MGKCICSAASTFLPRGRRVGTRSTMRGSTIRRPTAGGDWAPCRRPAVGARQVPDASAPVTPPRQPQRSLGTVEEYDPATNKWRARAPMPTPCNHMGGEAVNGKIYVIGGRLSGAFIIGFPGNINLVQAYDPAADTWVTKTPMPTPRSGLNTASLNGIIYVAGGEVQDDKYLAAYRAFEAYDPASDAWWQLPSMLLPRHECIMAALGNRIHVAGGSVH